MRSNKEDGVAKHHAVSEAKDVSDALLVEEYKSCRELLKINIDIIEKSEVYSVGAAAATVVYCLSSTVEIVSKTACWLPLVISLLGLVRFVGIDATINKINNHLVNIEAAYPKISWTQFYREQNTFKILKYSRYLIWAILTICSAAFGWYIFNYGPVAAPGAAPAAASRPQ
jgi:lysylphosphatidylglycerol synthetase-like protein (DUF2156 family)